MAFLIGGANSAADTAFSVANSCRFTKGDNAYLSKSLGAPTDADKFTVSYWIKLGDASAATRTFFNINNGSSVHTFMQIKTDHVMIFGRYASGYQGNLTTNQVFRDYSAWYNVVQVYDSGNATAGNRMRMYINGTEVTSFSTDTNPDQDLDSSNIDGATFFVGAYGDDDELFDGHMAEFCFIDGLALTPSSFGEFDEDSPTIWKPKDVSGLTFGNNGFYLDFEDGANLGNDKNGGTDLGETNLAAIDQCVDSPTNNFCVMNILDNYYGAGTFTIGNLKIVTLSSDYTYYTGTIGLTAGLWYFEAKLTATADDNQVHVGIAGRVTQDAQHELGHYNDTYAYYSADGDSRTNDGDTSYGTGFDTGDILGVYIDLSANKLYFAKNGTVQNSGTGISITAPASVTAGAYFPAVGDWANQSATWEVNFGNPSFSLSSAVADANGYGSFEYDPSSGTFDSASKNFLAICTKNLGSDGG